MVDIWFEIIWDIIVYDFNFSGVPDLMTTMKTNLKTIMIIVVVLTVTMKQYCEQH